MDSKNLQENRLELGCYSGAEGICEVYLHASTKVFEYFLARSDSGQKPEETMMLSLSQEPRDRIRHTKSQDAKEAWMERKSTGEPLPL